MSIRPIALSHDLYSRTSRKYQTSLQRIGIVVRHYDPYTMTNRLLLDGLFISIAFCLAYLLLYGEQIPRVYEHQIWGLAAGVAVGRLLIGVPFGIHRMQWRYLCMRDAFRLCLANVVFSLFLFLLRFSVPHSWLLPAVPVSVIVIELFLSTESTIALRVLRRYIYERQNNPATALRGTPKPHRLLLVGAGVLGSTVAKEIGSRPDTKLVGFLDDDPKKIGSTVAGARVIGPTCLLMETVQRENVDEVLVCIPPAARNSFNRLWALLEHLPIHSHFVPTIDEILDAPPKGQSPGIVKSRSSDGNRMQPNSEHDPARVGASEIRDKVVLITGGAGFIGSSLAERLAAENRVVLFDRIFKNQPISFTSLLSHRNVTIAEGDIMDSEVLAKIATEADIVVHAAAIVGVTRVCNHSRETLETNLGGTSRLLRLLEKNPRLQRVVYFSTSEVFGVNSFRVNENTPAAVGPAVEARWSYSIAKLAGEHLMKSYHRQTGMPIVTVRPFNIFGPRRLGAHAIRSFVSNALAGRPIEVHGDGSQIRSWCFIEDFCDALIEVMARPDVVGEDFNIGNPQNTLTIHQLARKVVELTSKNVPIVFRETDIPDIGIRVPSLEKARRLLGYEPKYEMDQALSLTIEWYRQHQDALSQTEPVTHMARCVPPSEHLPSAPVPALTEGKILPSYATAP